MKNKPIKWPYTIRVAKRNYTRMQALAAILLQKQNSGLWAAIAYYSQATNAAESRYHSFELEMLAVVKAIERFHIYLYGVKFIVITDCHAIVYMRLKQI